jgi:hypothetical protein
MLSQSFHRHHQCGQVFGERMMMQRSEFDPHSPARDDQLRLGFGHSPSAFLTNVSGNYPKMTQAPAD